MDEPDIITQETVIDAVRNPGELGDDVIREAAAKLAAMTPEAREMYLEELHNKALTDRD